jgi:hypothetical protein
MKKILFLIFLTSIYISYSQSFSVSLPNELTNLKEIKTGGTEVNYTLTQNYIVEAKIKGNNFIEINIKDTNGNNESFDIKPLSFPLFKTKFINSTSKLILTSEKKKISPTSFSELGISLLFARLVTYNNTESERPIVANITLQDKIPVKFQKTAALLKNSSNKIEYLKDVKVEISFFQGFIEKIELEGTLFSEKIRFTNLHSIGISSSKEIKNFVRHNLQSFYKYTLNSSKTAISKDYIGSTADYLKINLSNVLDYDREIDINANDISPEPVKLLLDSEQTTTKLYKEESTKLFEAIVYSDFFGVMDEENPNGIIQTEVKKRFNLNTDRKEIFGYGKWFSLLFPPVIYSEGYGFFEHIDVKAVLSKIEENNKFLGASTLDGTNYFSPIRVFQHQSFSIGGDFNILTLENQNKKINTSLNSGLEYGRSGLQISETKNEFLNTINVPIELKMNFIPEKRYGFIASNRLIYFRIYNDETINLKSIKNGALIDPENWLNKTELQFYVNTSQTGKLFIRYGFITELNNWDNNFSQFQFGYSFYILQRNGKKE